MQFRDEFNDLRLDMIHIEIGGKFDFVVVNGALLELRKCFLHIRAVVGFTLVFANRKAASSYDDAIFDVRQGGLKGSLFLQTATLKRGCQRIAGKVIAEGQEAARFQIQRE